MTQFEADDVRLVERLCLGDAAAAHELYHRHGGPLLRFGLAVTGSRQTAEDVVQDTFIEFLRRPGHFDPLRGSVASYLYGIARHRINKQRRPESSLDTTLAGDDSEVMRESEGKVEGEAEDQLDRERTVDRVRRAVLELPFAHREVVVLCDLQELAYTVVAGILDCPVGTVRSRLHRGRAMLAERLSGLREPVSGPGAPEDTFMPRLPVGETPT